VYSFELASKCIRRVVKEAPTLLHKLVRAVLFAARSWFFDLVYYPISEEKLKQLLQDFKKYLEEHSLHYENEVFDCEDFAIAFKHFAAVYYKTNAVGLALGLLKTTKVYDLEAEEEHEEQVLGGHGWNIVLLTSGELVYVEPQTCEYFRGNESPDGFTYELLAVVW